MGNGNDNIPTDSKCEGRDELVSEQPKKPGVHDLGANRPILMDEDEAVVDRISDRIRRDREAKRQRNVDA